MNSQSPIAPEVDGTFAHFQGPDICILRRVDPLDRFPVAQNPRPPFMTVALVDCETTGLEAAVDEIIDLAVVLLKIDAYGRVIEVLGSAESLREPQSEITPEINRLTGISNEDVAGIEFDPTPFVDLFRQADACIAHNASFDAPFVERLIPQITGMAWACSMQQFDWVAAGFDGCKLGHLLMQTGRFNESHRAMADVISLLHVLSFEPSHVGTVMADVIKMAMMPTVRIEATGAPFDKRILLKKAGYRWDPTAKVWWIEVADGLDFVQVEWLRDCIQPRNREPNRREMTWFQRHR